MSTEEKTMIAIMKPWGGTCGGGHRKRDHSGHRKRDHL